MTCDLFGQDFVNIFDDIKNIIQQIEVDDDGKNAVLQVSDERGSDRLEQKIHNNHGLISVDSHFTSFLAIDKSNGKMTYSIQSASGSVGTHLPMTDTITKHIRPHQRVKVD